MAKQKKSNRYNSWLLNVGMGWLMALTVSYALAIPVWQDNHRQRSVTAQPVRPTSATTKSKATDMRQQPKRQALIIDNEDSIPDSLLHPRWPIQRTIPITVADLDQSPLDLHRPDNLKQQVAYNDTLDRYIFGNRLGNTWIGSPIMMTPEEYGRWAEQKAREAYFRKQNDEIFQKKGKEKFDFSDMHFDLGPAEKIFGPGGVRIRTQGSAELKFGATLKNIDNPSLPIRNRKTTSMDFDEKINLNVNGKVGDKVNMNLNYNTDATFDFDAQNMKLKYDGKEDEIIKLVEGGNISFPSNSSLITGASSLFGLRTDLQFGKLKLQLVASQKKSSTTNVNSKGGVQLTPFEIDAANYEDNRHFFLGQYFRDRYDAAMRTLPNLTTGIHITRVEIWVTNKTGNTNNTRDIVALTDLGESKKISNPMWGGGSAMVAPANSVNSEYSTVASLAGIRDIDQASTTLETQGLKGGVDFEKVESARLLNSSEYTVNTALGYVSLNTNLQTDQVLAIAYEYTYNGQTRQVGEFASDNTSTNQALLVKSLKNTSNNPSQGNWDLMMKNVYQLASSVERDKFRLDIKYQSDTTGVYLSYIPEAEVKNTPLIKALGADRLDNNNKPHSNGYFDFVEGYTVSNGRVFLPSAEPFGTALYQFLVSKGVPAQKAKSYAFTELYDSTKTVARQIAEKDKFVLMGQFRGTSANVISLGAVNVPQGSVVVTAGGVKLTEGSDYSVDYNAGEVTILNQSIIDAGTNINVSLESNTDFSQMRKTMFGMNWEYDFSKNFQISGTLQHLTEQALTNKVTMGAEPVNNTLWGVNLNWKKESMWLTNMLDKIPFLHVTQPSQISFTGEFAQLIAGKASGTQDNASYLDDFENTKSTIDVSAPTSWTISSVPSLFAEATDKTSLRSGFNRSRMAWYTVDPLFTRRSSSLTPGHIKSDLEQLSDYRVREVPTYELYPNRDQSSYNGGTSTVSILNLAYYPDERGPYNFNTQDLMPNGHLANPQRHWGGMMRKLDTNDFEAANIEYVEFWMMDPFVYSNTQPDANQYGGDFYINLGEVSEDVLHDGKKFYESGMPVDGSHSYTETQWGRVPTTTNVTYAFATTKGSRALQDVGYNGLTDAEENAFYQNYLNEARAKVNDSVYQYVLQRDPAGDDYHYFRGSDWDKARTPILERYKYINNPQGNSPDSDTRSESYDTSYKTTPDVEDINQDYTLNEYEKYYQYRISLRPQDMVVGSNYIVDKRETNPSLRNGKPGHVTWYQFRIPLSEYQQRVGGINDFTSIRFMRMFLTNFKKPIVLRFANLDLVRGEWRVYEQPMGAGGTGTLSMSAVSIEENSDKQPVNYVLPPGINREQDPSQPQLVEANEQSLNLTVKNLTTNESKAVYKNTTIDLRKYKRLQMFVHANAFEPNTTNLKDDQLQVFIRLGNDYKSNYYEYEIPLKLTPAGKYNRLSRADCEKVWPADNLLNVPLSVFTGIKYARNKLKGQGLASYTQEYSAYDTDHPGNRVSIMGNPTLGEVKTLMIGVRNRSGELKSGEIWVNELRLLEYNNHGGWAANAKLDVQLSDLGSVSAQGRYMTDGFGGLEQGISQRPTDTYGMYQVTTSLNLGKFFPDKAKVSAPLYYSVTKERTTPKYNPLDTDMQLSESLDALQGHERDSLESIAITKTTNTNFSLSGVRVGIATKRHPMPYDPANFSFSYSHAHQYNSGQTTVYEKEDNWRGALDYNWTPVYKSWEPFKRLRSNSKWLDIFKRFGFNWLPQNVAFNTEMTRHYHEMQERDMESIENSKLPLNWSEQFLWNREFNLRWDLTRNLHTNFQSATHAQIEEPYTAVNKSLYPDRYEAWKDSVWQSIKRFGTPLSYNQAFTMSYQLPLNLLPIFDWMSANATYNANYNWARGSELEDGTSLGNTIANNRDLNINGNFNMERLYNHIPFLKKANERFARESTQMLFYNRQQEREKKKAEVRKQHEMEAKARKEAIAAGKDADEAVRAVRAEAKAAKQKAALPKNKRAFEKEIMLLPDTTIRVNHGKNSKRLIVSAKTEDGKRFRLKFRKTNANQILVTNKVDSALKLKVSVLPKEPLENLHWYKTAQSVARFLMMVRQINVSYRNQYAMTLPGFKPSVGDAFGQSRGGSVLAPGLDFAFGLIDDSYIGKARTNNWLLVADSLATPATTNHTEDLQARITLEPIRQLRIDLNATRVVTRAKNIQYMYEGIPTTQSGTFQMTTIALKSAFEGIGDANNGFHSKTFERFCNSLAQFHTRQEARYAGASYPAASTLAGGRYSSAYGGVDTYSAEVMVPAFLQAYTGSGRGSLNLFPSLAHMLPNWSMRYSGLGKLPWFRDVFRSFNINHAYQSIFSVGAYNSYATYMQNETGLGFITDATTGNPIPSSMFNISSVSLRESFNPLLGIDMTFNNNLTAKLEYRTTRTLNLSMTSVQINEARSNDWVVGMGYRMNNFNLFGGGNHRVVKSRNHNNSSKAEPTKVVANHDLNLRLDLSYRRQAAISRDIRTVTSSASSGNTAFKLSFLADYTLSKLLTMSFYYDRQTNTPLLSSSSYPTTTDDFGLSIKFSLTR